eukprot:scaffold196249_cov47-Attheya_sp.AAC.1
MGNRLSEIAGNRIGSGRVATLPSPLQLSIKVIYEWARDRGTLDAYRMVPAGGASGRVHMCHYGCLLLVATRWACCNRSSRTRSSVAVRWLSASYDRVVVWEGSFPPRAAAAAAPAAAMGHTTPKTLVIFCAERAHRKKRRCFRRFERWRDMTLGTITAHQRISFVDRNKNVTGLVY